MRLQPDRLLTKRVDPLVMKTLNAIELLELVRMHGPVSRAQLATCSRLSKPTVSDQVDSLISRALVVEVGPGNAGVRGGRSLRFSNSTAATARSFAQISGPSGFALPLLTWWQHSHSKPAHSSGKGRPAPWFAPEARLVGFAGRDSAARRSASLASRCQASSMCAKAS